jgi:nucleoside-diphosphate-sugar epimerase
MIIGKGDIASVLTDRDDLLFFTSGVSNSQCIDPAEFKREVELLRDVEVYDHIVYFSSLSIYDKDSPYTEHKIMMEELVRFRCKTWTIIRLGNITWGKNPYTIINFFKNKLRSGEEIEVRDEWKYLVTLDEFLYWIAKIPKFSTEMNITGERVKAAEVLERIKRNQL